MRRDSVSANYGALEHSFADLFQVSPGMLQGNIVPNDEIAVAPAVFEYALRRVEVVEQPVQRIAALLPVHPEQADGLQFAGPDTAAVIVRVDGDSWQSPDVPLGEDSEKYLVVVVKNNVAVREQEVGSPIWEYTQTEQNADGVGRPFEIIVSQFSQSFGPGPSRTVMVL